LLVEAFCLFSGRPRAFVLFVFFGVTLLIAGCSFSLRQ
jgi:hypothetical protein